VGGLGLGFRCFEPSGNVVQSGSLKAATKGQLARLVEYSWEEVGYKTRAAKPRQMRRT
jgi:hypothetical protein